MRRDIRAQEREIRMLQRAGVSTASAKFLLSRIRAKVEDLCREREVPRDAQRTQLVEADPKASRSLRARLGFRRFHRSHIEVEESVALVALFVVLLSQLDDLFEDFHVEPFSLGLREDLLFLLVQFLQFDVQVLNALHE
jgi:hypothetical protein